MGVLRRLRRPWAAAAFRLVVGGFFLAAGLAKLAGGTEAFAAQIRAYGLLGAGWEEPLALALPWVEMLSGGFLLAGLFSRWAAAAVALQLALFSGALALAMARGTSPEDCGCLPGLAESPLQALVRDLAMLAWVGAAAGGLPGRAALDGWVASADASGEEGGTGGA